MKRTIYGVGINDADFKVTIYVDGKERCHPVYRIWHAMMERCYSKSFTSRNPAYLGCSVDERWHYFSAFNAWAEVQNYIGRHLDKDLIHIGNKVYSEQNCRFIPPGTNLVLLDARAARGDWPIGVHYDKANGKYKAACGTQKGRDALGSFSDPMDAHHAWQRRKAEVIRGCAVLESCADVVRALHQRADRLLVDLLANRETINV